MVGSAGDLRDVFQTGEQTRPVLFLDELAGAVVAEPGLAFAILGTSSVAGAP
jgi:hypothetical protein